MMFISCRPSPKFIFPALLLGLACVMTTGCPGQAEGVVAEPDELELYTTPEGVDPDADLDPPR